MKGFYSRDKRKQFEERLKQEQEKYEQDLQVARSKKTKLSLGIQNLREHSKLLEAQKRLKALQKEEESRLQTKDHRDRYVNFLRKNRFSKENSNTIQALDLDIASKIPKPSQEKKIIQKIDEDSKIPKVSKISKFSKVALPAIPEKPDNLPWKKGELLDSLDLSSTNLKKFFQNKPKLCESPGRQATDDRSWLKENFRESIKEWAPRKTWNEKKAEDLREKIEEKIGFNKIEEKTGFNKIEEKTGFNKIEERTGFNKIEEKTGFNKIEEEAILNKHQEIVNQKKTIDQVNNEKIVNLKPTKRLVPRNGKAGLSEKLEELKELHRPEKKVKFSIEKNPEKASTRYTNSDYEEETPDFPLNNAEDPKTLFPSLKETNQNPSIHEKHLKKDQKPPLKPSKFVTKLKTLEKDTFLENELKCLNDEEARLEASLARLDIKSLKMKHQAELELLNQQAKNLEESLKRAQELPKNPVLIKEESFSEIEDETYKFKSSRSNSNSSPALSPRSGLVPPLRVKIDCQNENKLNKIKEFSQPELGSKNEFFMKNRNESKDIEEREKDRKKLLQFKANQGYSKQVQEKLKGMPDDLISVAPSERSGKSGARDPAPEPRARSVISGYSGRSGHAIVRVRVQAVSPISEKSKRTLPTGQEVIKVNPNIDLKSIFGDLNSP